jgi:cytochrome c-type biogenesis protein CcmE
MLFLWRAHFSEFYARRFVTHQSKTQPPSMKTRNLLLLIALGGFVAILVTSLSGSLSQYTDFRTAQTSGDDVHVVAQWVQRDRAQYDPTADRFEFYLQDTTGLVVKCVYEDPKPANFETAERIVVQGKYQNDAFLVSKIQMKCPSKYEDTQLEDGLKSQPAYYKAPETNPSFPG